MEQYHETILVVEDDVQIRNFICYALKAEGFRCVTAGNAATAMKQLLAEPVDMMLLDLGLPDMDGGEVLKKVREWSEMPIIIVSARDQDREKAAMLDLGATTFWEDFNLDWIPNAAPIDEPVPAGKKDIHGDFGAYCYPGFRHSLCHGWSSGPTTWLSDHVLGIKIVDVERKQISIEPHLGKLEWAKGTYPTPWGVIEVSHEKKADGKIATKVKLPKGVRQI